MKELPIYILGAIAVVVVIILAVLVFVALLAFGIRFYRSLMVGA